MQVQWRNAQAGRTVDIAANSAMLLLWSNMFLFYSIGMGKLINNIMTAVFFELSGVLPTEQALALLKDCQPC